MSDLHNINININNNDMIHIVDNNNNNHSHNINDENGGEKVENETSIIPLLSNNNNNNNNNNSNHHFYIENYYHYKQKNHNHFDPINDGDDDNDEDSEAENREEKIRITAERKRYIHILARKHARMKIPALGSNTKNTKKSSSNTTTNNNNHHEQSKNTHHPTTTTTPPTTPPTIVVESLDYVVPDNIPHRLAMRNKSHRSHHVDNVRKWLTSFLIGVCTGLVAYLVHTLIDKLFEYKFLLVFQQSLKTIHSRYAVYTAYNTILILLSSTLLIYLTPHAIGSGIPEVKGYLNGSRIPKCFNVTTLLGKVVGVIASVASSLPVGPEGPMIHIGSLIGGGLGEFRSRTIGCSLPMMEDFRNSRQRRDFISLGAACGVSGAFGAPIGGVLFALEEVSSHWSQNLTWRCFFGSMIACFTMNFFLSGLSISTYMRSFVLFEVSSPDVGYRLYEIVFFVLIGVIGGLLGALYTSMVIGLNRLRKRFLNRFAYRRWIEVVLFVVLLSTVCFYVPMLSHCKTRPNLNSSSSASVASLVGRSSSGSGNASLVNKTLGRGMLGRSKSITSVDSSSGGSGSDSGENDDQGTVSYTCGVNQYNELATLFLVKQEQTVKHLINRGFNLEFSMGTCVIFTCIYFLGSGFACGAALSSGLVVPILLVGAGYGRFIGLLVQMLFPSMKIDPGVYALIGASSFMGGVSRMTISMTVIIVEITNDLQYLFPIMLVTMISKWTGDLFTHPLYDMLLQLKDVPYLESEPSVVMTKLKCSDILAQVSPLLAITTTTTTTTPRSLNYGSMMLSSVGGGGVGGGASENGGGHVMPGANVHGVVCLRENMETAQKIVSILAECDHNGFPVVREEVNGDQVFVGIISKKHLLVLLKYAVLKNRKHFSEKELNRIVNGPHILLHKVCKKYTDAHWNKVIDLRELVNYSSLCVNQEFSVDLAYELFRSMGCRHLVVVNYRNQVVGMLTRKDFMEERLEHIYHRLKQKWDYEKRFH